MVVDPDYLTVLVWILRMVLPCILFWISFGPRLRTLWEHPPVPKDIMLAHREIVRALGEEAPEAVSNVMMVDAQQAPMLFQDRKPRADRDRPDRGERGERPERGDRGERSERNERGERPSKGTDPRRERRRASSPEPVKEPVAPERDLDEDRKRQEAEDQMHLESLVNFVAFSRREQKRFFLPAEHCIPPPPPPRLPTMPKDPDAPLAAIARANAEAQMVLHGALKTGTCGVVAARALHAQLVELDIEVEALTFELIVEACIQAAELKDASSFLMQMEASGQTPSSELLDRVMELYLEQKHKKPEDKTEAPYEQQEGKSSKNTVGGDAEVHLPHLPTVSGVVPTGHIIGGHTLDVAGLRRLVVTNPPPPPPVRAMPSVYPHPVTEYNHVNVMNHMGMFEMPSIILPTQWQPRGLQMNRTMMPPTQAMQSSGHDADAGKNLPAFSIPDEFAVKDSTSAFEVPEEFIAKSGNEDLTMAEPMESAAASVENGDPTSFSAMGSEAATSSTAPAGSQSWTFSAHAAEFVPGDVQAPGSSVPSLCALVGPPGQIASASQAGEFVPVVDSWNYMPQAPEDEAFDQSIHADDGSGGFEFSPGAATFTPMNNSYMVQSDQAELHSGLRAGALPFVPGEIVLLEDGTRGQVVGPPVLMPFNAVMPLAEHADRSDEEWSNGEEREPGGGFDRRQQAQIRRQGPQQNAGGGKGRQQGVGGSARIASGALAAAMGPGQVQRGGRMPRTAGKGASKAGSSGGSEDFVAPVPPGPVVKGQTDLMELDRPDQARRRR